MIRAFHILVFMLCIASCNWSPPIKLETTPFSFVSSIYLHTSQATVVISRGDLSNESSIEFGTRAISNNHSPKPFVLLDSNQVFGKVIGDGKRLFLAEFAPRVKPGDPCTMEQPNGCLDVLFRESLDNGQTWSVPIRVPRPNMNDAAIRLFPNIVHIKETGRLYIFYKYSLADESKIAIGYVTRPPGSTVFSQERLIFQDREIVPGIGAGYTFENGKFMLHLAWREGLTALMYTSSNNGITWKPPTKKATLSPNTQYLDYISLLAQQHRLFLAYIGQYWTGYILHSEDQGNTWSEPIKVMDPMTDQLTAAYCEDRVFIAGIRKQNFYLSSFNAKTQEVRNEGKAFEELAKVDNPMISCIKIKDGKYKIAVAATTEDSMKSEQAYYSETEISTSTYQAFY
eukprot:TRINITY_DN5009_c0_g1_i1.p1 TRINITY_DN5009_c0_g1~~TRINITY_DN5009_c0_g1_i1.p1  ORF type:complete len:430 (-),score=2.95 TRINITY_DN5009_c0_g1_i1:51-1247(-)